MIICYIILGLFVLLWVIPLIVWHFTATPEEEQEQKELEKKLIPHIGNKDFRYSLPFMN